MVLGGAESDRVLKSKSGKKAGKKSKQVDRCFEQEMANYEASMYALYEDTDQEKMSEGLRMYEMTLDDLGNATAEVMEGMTSSMTHNGVYYGPDDPFWEEMKGLMQAYVAGPKALVSHLEVEDSHLEVEDSSGRRLKHPNRICTTKCSRGYYIRMRNLRLMCASQVSISASCYSARFMRLNPGCVAASRRSRRACRSFFQGRN